MAEMDDHPRYVYVDVDDTLVRSVGSKRIPMPSVIAYVRRLKERGAEVYCWSSGGAVYARTIATELGISDCFVAFLPKPQLIVDDQNVSEWKSCVQLHPTECESP
jgi:predicted HAD superfamily phosphohydrolase YqeG